MKEIRTRSVDSECSRVNISGKSHSSILAKTCNPGKRREVANLKNYFVTGFITPASNVCKNLFLSLIPLLVNVLAGFQWNALKLSCSFYTASIPEIYWT